MAKVARSSPNPQNEASATPSSRPSFSEVPRTIALNVTCTTAQKSEAGPGLVSEKRASLCKFATNGKASAAEPSPRPSKIATQCLPRGGTYLSTNVGPIQVGIPPETIKDSMTLGLPVPQYYVVPPEAFCRNLGNSLGVNVAEFEFPAYYNFFLKGNTVKLVVDSVETEKRIRALMQETLLGPEEIDASIDFASSVPAQSRPDIAKELSYFRAFNGKELSVDLLITFIHMNSDGVAIIDGVKGTPGGDWCVSIATSDVNGGEYIITEHQRRKDPMPDGGTPDSPENEACCEGNPRNDSCEEVSTSEAIGMGTEEDKEERGTAVGSTETTTSRKTSVEESLGRENMIRHLSTALSEVDREEKEEVVMEEESLGDGRGDKGKRGRQEAGGSSGREQQGSGETRMCILPGVKTGIEENSSSNTDRTPPQRPSFNGGSEAAIKSKYTPSPPMDKSSPIRHASHGSGDQSFATRFARWVVQTTHIGGRKRGGVGDCADRDSRPLGDDATTKIARKDVSEASNEPMSEVRPPAMTSGEVGQVATARAPKPTARTEGPSVKGFVPVRSVQISMTCPLPTKLPFQPQQIEDEFLAPTFGTTVLGNSHGFDPKGSTSGYVLWINGRGYMIDPPPYASMILQASNIRPSLIAGVIVTHCHADHDAGTFQKVLLDGQINIISTRTIYESFIRKYTALSGMRVDLIRASHNFIPVTIGQCVRLNGASFDFFYTLHSIPCIGFEVVFNGKGMSFSADHMNDPGRIRQMCEEGFLSEGRRDALLNFPWHHDLIFHEAGIPPIHTPIQTLKELSDDIKKRLYVVHVSEASIPKDSGLKAAPQGVENTIRLDMPPSAHHKAMDVLDLICSVGMLSHVSVAQARSLLEVARTFTFEANTIMQHRNVDTTDFAIIRHGRAIATAIQEPGARRSFRKNSMVLRRGDCYGEELLLGGSVRRRASVDVLAVSDVEALLFNGQDLEQIIGLKTKPLEDSYRIDRLLVYNSVLSALSRRQMLQLETFTQVKYFAAGETVWRAGQPVERVVLVAKGKLAFVNAGKNELVCGACPSEGQKLTNGQSRRAIFCPTSFLPGALIGRAGTAFDPPGSNQYRHTLRAVMDSVVLAVSRDDMATFSYSNPGVFMAIHDLQFVC